MKLILFGYLLFFAKISFAQIEVFRLSDQPASFYKTSDVQDAVINETTAKLIGNGRSITGMKIEFRILKEPDILFYDTTFTIKVDEVLYETIAKYQDTMKSLGGIPIVFVVDKQPLLVAFAWSRYSSIGCNCIIASTDKDQSIYFRLGVGGMPAEKKQYYYNKFLVLFERLKKR